MLQRPCTWVHRKRLTFEKFSNFGVTRRGRVVFYDYDELCFLTDCNFRNLPQARTYEEEISAEPWFSVRENDVFPEEFLNFLHLPGPARTALFEQHADLFHPDFLVQRAREASRRRDSGSISISAGATVVAAN
jgi:isocitrate dehydrogenase kinase/phosphatase